VKLALIVNPFATRVSEERLASVRAELERAAVLDVLLTERPGHATELVTNAERDGAEAVVVFSGDGGFNEALNGLESDVPIGFLPGGGTSVLAREIGLPRDPVAAARQVADALAAGRVRRISVGRVNGRRFGFSAGIGLPAEIVRRVDALGRSSDGRRPGDLAFAAALVRSLVAHGGRLEPQLEIEGFGRGVCAFIANGSPYTYAGRLPLQLVPETKLEQGLDLLAPVRVTRPALVPTVIRALTGHVQTDGFLRGHDLDRIEVRCDVPLPLHVDGEDLGDVVHATFEVERAAVSVLA
jgi:diacylglycerol kinase family enzyme